MTKPQERGTGEILSEFVQRMTIGLDAIPRLTKAVQRQADVVGALQQGVEKVVVEAVLLDVIRLTDTVESAKKHFVDEEQSKRFIDCLEGFRQDLTTILVRHGVEEINTVDVAFDPDLHRAVEVTGEDKSMVGKVLRAGYRFVGRVLRPADVSVGPVFKRTRKEAA